MLILAGVTIAMLSGNNSAPQKATEAAQKDAIAGAKDEIAMEVQEALLNYYNNTYVEGDGTKEKSIQEVVSGAASTAVGNAEKRNSQLLESSGVSGNKITLETKSYTTTGTIDTNGGITWSDIVSKENGTEGEPKDEVLQNATVEQLQEKGYSVGKTPEGHILAADTQDEKVILYEYDSKGNFIKKDDLDYTSSDIFDFDKDTGAITGIKSNEEAGQLGYYEDEVGINMGKYTELVIPKKIGGVAVTSVKLCPDSDYSDLIGIKRIIVPSTVTTISERAFRNCDELEVITLPSDLTRIENDAFYECRFKYIILPNRLKYLSGFDGCENLNEIEIPNSVTSIGVQAFMSCHNLSSIKLPSGLTSIGYHAFNSCHNLSSINIPSSVTSIGRNAFVYCRSLNSIEIPSSVTSIEEEAFADCTSLSKVWIPSSVQSIGRWAFSRIAEDAIIYVEDEQVKQLLIASGFSDENRIKVGSYPGAD